MGRNGRNPENERYVMERDLDTKLRPLGHAYPPGVQANNPRRRKKPKPQRNHGEVPYQKTRRDRRRMLRP